MSRLTSIRTVARTHHVDYRWTDRSLDQPVIKDGHFHTLVATAEEALTAFHRVMQQSVERDTNRQVIRDRLAPGDYRILRLYAVHQRGDNLDRAVGDYVYDDYPVPASANPDLPHHLVETPAVETGLLPFPADLNGTYIPAP